MKRRPISRRHLLQTGACAGLSFATGLPGMSAAKQQDGPLRVFVVGTLQDGTAKFAEALHATMGGALGYDPARRSVHVHDGISLTYGSSLLNLDGREVELLTFAEQKYWEPAILSGAVWPDACVIVSDYPDRGRNARMPDAIRLAALYRVPHVAGFINITEPPEDYEEIDEARAEFEAALEYRNVQMDAFGFGWSENAIAGADVYGRDSFEYFARDLAEILNRATRWSEPAATHAHQQFDASLYFRRKDENGMDAGLIHLDRWGAEFHFGEVQSYGDVVFSGPQPNIFPGDVTTARVRLNRSAKMGPGTRFHVSEGGRVIAHGVVHDTRS